MQLPQKSKTHLHLQVILFINTSIVYKQYATMLLTALRVLLGLLLGAWAYRHLGDGWRTCQLANRSRLPSIPSQGARGGPKSAKNGALQTKHTAGGGGSRPNTADGGHTAKLVALGLDLASESTAAAAAVLQRLTLAAARAGRTTSPRTGAASVQPVLTALRVVNARFGERAVLSMRIWVPPRRGDSSE